MYRQSDVYTRRHARTEWLSIGCVPARTVKPISASRKRRRAITRTLVVPSRVWICHEGVRDVRPVGQISGDGVCPDPSAGLVHQMVHTLVQKYGCATVVDNHRKRSVMMTSVTYCNIVRRCITILPWACSVEC